MTLEVTYSNGVTELSSYADLTLPELYKQLESSIPLNDSGSLFLGEKKLDSNSWDELKSNNSIQLTYIDRSFSPTSDNESDYSLLSDTDRLSDVELLDYGVETPTVNESLDSLSVNNESFSTVVDKFDDGPITLYSEEEFVKEVEEKLMLGKELEEANTIKSNLNNELDVVKKELELVMNSKDELQKEWDETRNALRSENSKMKSNLLQKSLALSRHEGYKASDEKDMAFLRTKLREDTERLEAEVKRHRMDGRRKALEINRLLRNVEDLSSVEKNLKDAKLKLKANNAKFCEFEKAAEESALLIKNLKVAAEKDKLLIENLNQEAINDALSIEELNAESDQDKIMIKKLTELADKDKTLINKLTEGAEKDALLIVKLKKVAEKDGLLIKELENAAEKNKDDLKKLNTTINNNNTLVCQLESEIKAHTSTIDDLRATIEDLQCKLQDKSKSTLEQSSITDSPQLCDQNSSTEPLNLRDQISSTDNVFVNEICKSSESSAVEFISEVKEIVDNLMKKIENNRKFTPELLNQLGLDFATRDWGFTFGPPQTKTNFKEAIPDVVPLPCPVFIPGSFIDPEKENTSKFCSGSSSHADSTTRSSADFSINENFFSSVPTQQPCKINCHPSVCAPFSKTESTLPSYATVAQQYSKRHGKSKKNVAFSFDVAANENIITWNQKCNNCKVIIKGTRFKCLKCPEWYNIICDGCELKNFTGERYSCRDCEDFDYCSDCINIHAATPKHSQYHAFENRGLPPMRWNGVFCDGCKKRNFTGPRYKCSHCYDVDLCETCVSDEKILNGLHTSVNQLSHTFMRLDSAKDLCNRKGVCCDNCSIRNFAGVRWKCAHCDNYDLCQWCYEKFDKNMINGCSSNTEEKHPFLKMIPKSEKKESMRKRVREMGFITNEAELETLSDLYVGDMQQVVNFFLERD
ncbi:hypothetical protein HK099_007790 [Clydaea vesicula]|uniref:ZZ-type domain-containing protein n=1 Tax=Clydaea vesicula TaxID=447962 RepID=A0AAD5XXB0_9FUNG|nr:hypothetical protein HK099_007790 [Clydaea vesicula]